jgi:hypothetical protein
MSTDLKKKKSQSATLESPGLSLRNSSTQWKTELKSIQRKKNTSKLHERKISIYKCTCTFKMRNLGPFRSLYEMEKYSLS